VSAREKAASQKAPSTDRPIFMVGMGRSGSTLLFECLATHPDVGWLAHHANRMPDRRWLYALSRLCDHGFFFRKAIERSDQRRSLVEKLRLGPAEAYETWASICGDKIRYDWLLGAQASPAERAAAARLVADVLRWAGKTRFAAKFTGPPRMTYLASLLPGAVFLHVVRDGRAVARSLLNVDFWRDTWRMERPAWSGGFPDDWLRLARESSNPPLALAALQWRRSIEVAADEAAALGPGRVHEVRYERFLADPAGAVDAMLRDVGLAPSPRVHDFLRRRYDVRDMNAPVRREGSPQDRALLERLLGDTLRGLGYPAGDGLASDA